MTDDIAAKPPLFTIVRGDAQPEEVAALVAIVAALAGRQNSEEIAATGTGGWRDRAHSMRGELRPGPDAWRASRLAH